MPDVVNMSIDEEAFNQMIWNIAKEMANSCTIDLCKIQTLTSAEVAKKLHATRQNVAMWQSIGMLVPIRVGKSYAYSPKEVERFEDTYRGYDIGNREKAMKAYQNVKEKAVATNND